MHKINIPDWLKAHVKERRGAVLSFGDAMMAGEAQGYLRANAGGNAASA